MNEQEMAVAAQELELLRMQLDNMNKQDELIQITFEEYTRARGALEDLKGKEKGAEILVPIGANCWVHAKLGDTSKAIASIGSNVAVGQKLEAIIERLDRQLTDIEKAQGELSSKISKVEARANQLAAALEDAYGKMDSRQSQ